MLVVVCVDFYFVGWNYGMYVGGLVMFVMFVLFGICMYELIELCLYVMK